MIEQIKYILLKLLFASAIVAAFSGFTILADGEQPQISKANLPAANKKPDEKPVFRCPKKSFLTRAGCHQPKPFKTAVEINQPQTVTENEKTVGNQISSLFLSTHYSPFEILND